MLTHYLKIAWRNILRHKASTVINILSLSLGICACIVIYVICNYEFSFDTFHPGNKRIYRVMTDVTESTGNKLHFAKVPFSLSIDGRKRLAGLESIASIIPYKVKITVPGTDNSVKIFESNSNGTAFTTTGIAEPQYFDIFKYKWLAGDANTALSSPRKVVLTEGRAYKYFGKKPLNEIIGKQVIYEDSLVVRVSGIIKEWDKNSDLMFTDFISSGTLQSSFLKNKISIDSWKQNAMSAWVFTKLKEGTTVAGINSQILELVRTQAESADKLFLRLEPLSNIHFNFGIIENPIRTAHKPTLYRIVIIAVFILILAVINFVNLSTAQSLQRVKATGVRKVLGSGRASLVFQFLTETFVVTLFAVSLATALVNPILSIFHSFIPAGVSFHFLEPSTIVFLILFTIVTTLLAGFYPAKVLSSYLPVRILKGETTGGKQEKWMLRKVLIVFQFAISLLFIIGSLVMAKQLRYTRMKELGFTSDAILTIETPRGGSLSKIPILVQKIKQINGVANVALQWLSPMTDNPRGMKLKFKSTDEKDFWVTQVAGNENFIPLYNIKILAGRNLVKSDSVNELVINESLSGLMGFKDPGEALGKMLYWNDKPYPVSGVVADFHVTSLHDPITPLCIINRAEREGSLAIKLRQPAMIKTVLSQMEQEWKQIYPSAMFNYKFYNESLALLYQKDQQAAMLINTSTIITIFISCIGLLGLMLFATQKKAKEISIRKILGATIGHILMGLGKDFILLVAIAFLIASPIAWYIMHQWLQEFAYRVNISWWIFALAGLASIIIALIIISFQAIKAAIANPVKNLRTD